MPRKVLFATDLSNYARAVTDCVAGLAQSGVREAVLLHVVDAALSYVEGAVGFDVVGQLRLDAQRALADEARRLEDHGLAVQTRVEVGVPAREIVRVAEEEGVWLIVVGAYGRTLFEDVLLGSVAERVLHLARRPVLVERPRVLAGLNAAECQRRGARTFARILLPTDFSPAAEVAQRFVAGLNDPRPEGVVCLHVLDERALRGRPGEAAARREAHAVERLQRIVADLEAHGVPAQGRLERGIPVDKIVEVAEEEGVGSTVVGSRGRGMVAELLLGSTADGVVRRSRGPVVVVPRRAADGE